MSLRAAVKDYRLAFTTLAIVVVLAAVRWVLWVLGLEGLAPTALFSSIIGGGVFVMGLVVAGTLSDYRSAERAPSDLAGGLYSILRETEQMHQVWGKPDIHSMRARLIDVVDALRKDIDAGNTRQAAAAVEELSESFLELDTSDVPANYIVRLRQEQAGLRKAVLRVYHIQRERFLPSAYTMIVSFVVMIILLLMVTNMGGVLESVVTVAFLAFFFIYLLRLLNVINTPFKVGVERGDDDVSLFILYEFVVYAKLHDQDLSGEKVVQIAEKIEELEEAAFGAGSDPDAPTAEETVAPTDLAETLDLAAEAAPDSETHHERT
jgi:ABC-type multidrug transport system fused ATPase/permease subunit